MTEIVSSTIGEQTAFLGNSFSEERFTLNLSLPLIINLRDREIPEDLRESLTRDYCGIIKDIFQYTGNLEYQTQLNLLKNPSIINFYDRKSTNIYMECINPYVPTNFEIRLVIKEGQIIAGYSTFIFKLENGDLCSGALYLFTLPEARGSGLGTKLYESTVKDLHERFDTKYHFGEVTDPDHVYTESDRIQAKKTLEYWKNRGRMQISAPWFESVMCENDEVIAFNKDLLTVIEMPGFSKPERKSFTKEEFIGIWKAFNHPAFLHSGANQELSLKETIKEIENTGKNEFLIEPLGSPR